MSATEGASPRSAAEVVREIYVTHRGRDTPGFGDLVAADVVWETSENHPLRGDGPWVGRDAVVAQITNPINEDFADYTTEIDQFIEAGDQVITVGRYRGTYRATGKPLDAQVCTIYTVEDGLVVRFQQFTDTAQFRAVMGAPPL